MLFQFLTDLPNDRTQQHIAPIVIAALIGAAAKGVGAVGSAISKKKQAQAAAAQAEKDRIAGVAADENAADPFRHSLAQMNAASTFDQIQNTRQKTVSIPGLNPKFMPKLGGGYQPSQELRDAAGVARTAALSGQGQALSMTDPNNYGKTNILDLLAAIQNRGLTSAPGGGTNFPVANRTMPAGGAFRAPTDEEVQQYAP
ncbi:MAG: hypothetical protein IT181_13215 [Acidobacteria bacterium]|nr:hypothetical protein [Acidobacteriota bacterium]